MIEKFISVQDMIALGIVAFVVIKIWQSRWKNGR
jgi:hypothetical protein